MNRFVMLLIKLFVSRMWDDRHPIMMLNLCYRAECNQFLTLTTWAGLGLKEYGCLILWVTEKFVTSILNAAVFCCYFIFWFYESVFCCYFIFWFYAAVFFCYFIFWCFTVPRLVLSWRISLGFIYVMTSVSLRFKMRRACRHSVCLDLPLFQFLIYFLH